MVEQFQLYLALFLLFKSRKKCSINLEAGGYEYKKTKNKFTTQKEKQQEAYDDDDDDDDDDDNTCSKNF